MRYLVTALMVVLVLLLAVGIWGCSAYNLDEEQQLRAESGARDFAERAGMQFVSCSGTDSDFDNYVTCAVGHKGQLKDIECSYESKGCKTK